MRVTYPVIFTDVENNILIEVPDLNILTEANEEGKRKASMAEAIMMARDAIGLKYISDEDEGMTIAEPSPMYKVDVKQGTFYEDGEGVVSLVDVDILEYRRKFDKKTVRRNVTLPNWLNLEPEKAQINVSRVLQEALMDRLQVRR